MSCGSGDLTRLPMVLTDGTDVLFVSCQVCEGREWLTESDGQWLSLPIDTVIRALGAQDLTGRCHRPVRSTG